MFRPMLAIDFEERRLRFPYYASPKLDGIRCLVLEGEALTRSLKRFPNRYVAEWFRERAEQLAGFDGELIVGDPNAKDVYNQTASGLMRYDGRPAFHFFVFDVVDPTRRRPFTDRAEEVRERLASMKNISNVTKLLDELVPDMKRMRFFEDRVLDMGFEGVMLRAPEGHYKQGRSTVNEGLLLKVKRFRDAEAVVVGVEEQMHNANVATRNELGRTKRSSAKAGLVGKGTLGALIVKGAPGQPFAGVSFGIGTGLDDAQRQRLWDQRVSLAGSVVKYRFFDIGTKDAPRHPVFVGFRKEGT